MPNKIHLTFLIEFDQRGIRLVLLAVSQFDILMLLIYLIYIYDVIIFLNKLK
jgi:hypothetical protein